jgi:membrane associated rhomboid family serine protease
VTPILIGINVAVFVLMVVRGVPLLAPTPADILPYGANFGPLTTSGGWWRLLSSTFIHIGLVHLLMNMWVLWTAGPTVERMFGSVSFAVAYLIAGLAGSVASVGWHPDIVSAGASGAIFGVYGMLGAFLLRQRGALSAAVLSGLRGGALAFVGYNVVYGATQSGIDMAAHVGGLAGGFLIGLPLVRGLTPEARAGQRRRAATTGAAGALLLAGICAVVPRAFSVGQEMMRIGETEHLVGAHLNALEKQGVSTEELAALVERELVPKLEETYRRVRDHRGRLSAIGQKHADIFLELLDRHRQATRMLIDGLRSNDRAVIERANRMFEESSAAVVEQMKPSKAPGH